MKTRNKTKMRGIQLTESSFESLGKLVSDSLKKAIQFTNPKPVLDSAKPAL